MKPAIHLGPLSAVALGDTYGAQFEYRRGPWLHLNTGEAYTQHASHLDLAPGCYTDDTQLSIPVARFVPRLLAGEKVTEAQFAASFVEAYARNPRVGYSKGMEQALKLSIASKEPLEQICARVGKSEKSGAAMRATPLGLLPSWRQVTRVAALQGSVTHRGEALLAAQGAALAAHYMLHQLGPRAAMPAFVAELTRTTIWLTPWQGPVGSPGMQSTRAALTAVVQATSLKDLLIRACAFTGDVDTVAAIAMGCGWNYPCLPNDLPASLWQGLETGPYGRTFLAAEDAKLEPYLPHPSAMAECLAHTPA